MYIHSKNIFMYIYNIRTLSVNIKFICTSFRNRQNSEPFSSFSGLFRSEYKWILYLTTMYVYCVYPAMSKKSENLSGLRKKDRNKRHSSPFINVVRGLFFVVRVTLVPVPYLSSLSAVHSYRVPGKCIRRVNSLFVGWKVYSPSTNKANIIRIAYLYSKCTDCRIFSNNIGLGLGFLTPLSPILKLYRESQFYCWRKPVYP